jgi:hypothetical protein
MIQELTLAVVGIDFSNVDGSNRRSEARGAPAGSWLEGMLARKPRMLVTVALANKMARTVWALLVRREDYRAPVAVAA